MVKAMPKAKGNRLKRSTVLALPNQVGKLIRVRFPAEYGDRIGNKASIKIEQFDGNNGKGNVLRTWTSPNYLQKEKSPFGGGANVYYADVEIDTSKSPGLTGSKKGKPRKGLAPGDLILVTVTVTVPPVPEMGEEPPTPETIDVFEIEASAIDLP